MKNNNFNQWKDNIKSIKIEGLNDAIRNKIESQKRQKLAVTIMLCKQKVVNMSKKANLKISKSWVEFLEISTLILLFGVLIFVFIVPNLADKQTDQIASHSENKTNDAYASISSNDIQRNVSEGDSIWNARDPYYGYNKLPVVALVHIDSIDGGRNYSPIFEQFVYPQTYGKMTVLEVYKGDVKPGEQLTYARLGGIITFEEYWNGLSEAQKNKILYQNNGIKPVEKKYVQEKFLEDIDIEADKNYVVFLQPQTSKDGKNQEYFIDGMQYGLREAKGYVDGSDAKLTVLNNETKEWEAPSRILKNYDK